MNEELEDFDEDLDNPFDLMDGLGWCVSEQENYDEECEFDDDWEGDVALVSFLMFESSLAGWGKIAGDWNFDESSGFCNEPEPYEFSPDYHIRLVRHTLSEERRSSQSA
jgi:hypothetical protein